jgi:hypothetical protein
VGKTIALGAGSQLAFLIVHKFAGLMRRFCTAPFPIGFQEGPKKEIDMRINEIC